MRRRMMKSKIHRATVTDANLHYVGSITLDTELMELADIRECEQVARASTSTTAPASRPTPSPVGPGDVCLNGAAARLVQPGDRVIIITYADYDDAELEDYEPAVVHVDTANRPIDEDAAAELAALEVGPGPDPHGPAPRSSAPAWRARGRLPAVTAPAAADRRSTCSSSAAAWPACPPPCGPPSTHGMRVGVLTKGELHQATTRWAQGGVAAVLGRRTPTRPTSTSPTRWPPAPGCATPTPCGCSSTRARAGSTS